MLETIWEVLAILAEMLVATTLVMPAMLVLETPEIQEEMRVVGMVGGWTD